MKKIDEINAFWKDKKNIALLHDAELLAHEQRETNRKYDKSLQNKYYDRSLSDIRRYKRNGQYVTIHHMNLMSEAIAGEYTCPVLAISIKVLNSVQRAKKAAARQILVSSQKAKAKPQKAFNLMEIGEAKRIFYKQYLSPLFLARGIEYQVDEDNKKVLHDLVCYFTRQKDCSLDLNKGICLYGGVGTGKTSIMKALSNFTKDFELETAFDFVYMNEVESACSKDGLHTLDNYKNRTCFFDDIGKRMDGVNSFGTKIDPYSELVTKQYNRFIRKNVSLSHYSTNIDFEYNNISDAMIRKFGTRELDRFNEMCNFVFLGGGSRRDY